MKHQVKDNITLIQWNANGIDKNGPELLKKIETEKLNPDIICIQETFLKAPKTFEIKGYAAIRKDRIEKAKGGLITFVKEEMSYQEIQGPENIECQITQIGLAGNKRKLHIVNIYNPPNNEIRAEEYNKLFKLQNAILIGDFNAKNRSWGNPKENREGVALEKLIDEHDFVVINTGEPTFQRNEGGTSILDLTIVANNLALKCNWNIINDTCGSDHMPIHIKVFDRANMENANTEKWQMQKADWKMYKKMCEEQVGEINEDEIEAMKEKFQNQLLEVAARCIPKTVANKNNQIKAVPYWNEKCTIATKERNRARNKLNGYKTGKLKKEYQRLKGVANKVIQNSKKEHWEKYCNSLTDGTKLGKVWKMSKKMDGNNNNKRTIPNLKLDDRVFETNKEKAEILAETFAAISSDDNYDKEFLLHRREVEEKQTHLFTDDTSLEDQNTKINEPFTIYELNQAINRTKKKSSPGADTISYEMIKELPTKSRIGLLKMYNKVWKEGIMPKEWKHALILPFIKPGKEPTSPKSYRPISLTSCLCKIMEQMVTKRLTWYLESNKLLTKAQTGFRKGRNTQDQIIKLHEQIYKYMKNKGHTVGVFLDFEKAYDLIWRNGLLTKIKKIGVNGNMFKFIKDFVSNRTFQVQVGNERSNIRKLENGTPQGSVISPILFLIMINDLKEATDNVQLSLFADDSSTYKSGKNLKYIMKEIQRNINQIHRWCQTWGFKVSTEKSSTVIFTNKKQQTKTFKPIMINEKEIKTESKVKFLGMMFDEKLTWEHHIKYIVDKCKKRLNLMRCLAGTKWGASKKCQLILYRTLIRSILDYGCIAYDSTAKIHKKQLQTVQNTALRLCCGAFRSTAASALQVDCGEMPLDLRRKKLQLEYAINIKLQNDHPNKEILHEHWTKSYGKFKKDEELWTTRLADTIERINVKQIEEEDNPPWQEFDITINTELAKERKLEFQEYKNRIEEHMRQFNDRLAIYTDAAKDQKEKVSYAIYIPKLEISIAERLTDGTSVDTAEIQAMDVAINWAIQYNDGQETKQEKGVVIYSDSLRGVNSIKKEMKINESPKIFIDIVVVWIPAHENIKDNEKVDWLAKKALGKMKVEKIIKPGKREAYACIDQIVKNDWQQRWTNDKTGSFFREIEPNIGNKITYTDDNRNKETTISRLRFGKGKLNHHLYQMKLHPDGTCDKCGAAETVAHILVECPASEIKEKIQEICIKENIDFNIKNILNSTEAIDVIFKNLKRRI